MTPTGWTSAWVLAILALAAVATVSWFAIGALIEIKRAARELRESLQRLTPLAENTLRQSSRLTETAAQEVADFARWRQSSFANVASGLGTVLAVVRAFLAPRTPRDETTPGITKRSEE